MRALVYRRPGLIEMADVPEPDLPAGGVVVETAYAGVCGSDVRSWRHGSPRLSGEQVLGHEVSGTVVASDVAQLPVGTRIAACPGVSCLRCAVCQRGGAIWCPNRRSLGYDFAGGMAERFALPAGAIEVGCAVPLPDGLSLLAASLAEPLHTVLNGQDQAAITAGDSVLVVGLGPIGALHVAVARSRGADVVLGIDRLPERTSAAADVLGADSVRPAPADSATVRGWAPRDGWDVVVVAAGSAAAVELAMAAVANGGRVLAFGGMPAGQSTVALDVNRIHYQQLRLIGAFGGSPELFRQAVSWLARCDLDVRRFVTNAVPLAEAPDAFAMCEQGLGLKTSIAVNPERPERAVRVTARPVVRPG
jgi:L-iditol 2-dehydrogenase